MSSTRKKSQSDSAFYQNRYASSPEFERGISATLTAKRCSILDSKDERLLLWFIQWLSWQPGELEKLSAFIRENGGRFYSSLDEMTKLCVDPATGFKGELYHGAVEYIRDYRRNYIRYADAGFKTVLGQKVCEVLNYTSFSRGLTLMEGEARTGKSFAARAWCASRAGAARFVEVPPGNDDTGFFRALARGLGAGNFLQYKSREIRDRVESVLLAGDLVLVLDEAHRLWPQRNLRQGFPARVEWVMSMANAGVPIAMVSTPQFLETQKAVEKHGWNSAQLNGRISRYEPLPRVLSREDLISVAKAILPEADAYYLKGMAAYARKTARYLGAIDSMAKRARYLAMKSGRDRATLEEIRMAMLEVAPSDTLLKEALGKARAKDLRQLDDPPPLPGNRVAAVMPDDCSAVATRLQPAMLPV